MRLVNSSFVVVGALFLALFLGCGGKGPDNSRAAMDARADKRDALRMAQYKEQLEQKPHDCGILRERAAFEESRGTVVGVKGAIADWSECIQFGPKDARADAYYQRAKLHENLFKRANDPSEKIPCLADYDEAMKLDPRSSKLFLDRAGALAHLFGEPFLAEEDLIQANHLANYEEKTSESEQTRFIAISGVYKALAKATKGTPASAEYQRMADKAVKAWDALYERDRRLAAAVVAERNRQRAIENAAIRAEEERVAAIDAKNTQRREKAEAELQEQQRKVWANRTRCHDCNGNGYTMRGASTEHRIDWVQTDARHEKMRVTHRETPSSRNTCTTCWGKGWLDKDDR